MSNKNLEQKYGLTKKELTEKYYNGSILEKEVGVKTR